MYIKNVYKKLRCIIVLLFHYVQNIIRINDIFSRDRVYFRETEQCIFQADSLIKILDPLNGSSIRIFQNRFL